MFGHSSAAKCLLFARGSLGSLPSSPTFVIAMALTSAMSLLAAELPEFDVGHGLAGAHLGDLDEHPLLVPPSSTPAVRARAGASAAAPLSKAPPSTPAIERPKKYATLEDIFIQLSLPERLRAPLLGLLGADPRTTQKHCPP